MSKDFYLETFPRQPWRRCPFCGALHDGITAANDHPGAKLEPPDAVMICGDCGEWGMFDPAVEGQWRMPTADERRRVMNEPDLLLVIATVRDARDRRGR